MNLFSTTNVEGVSPDQLPPREARGRFRLLVVTMRYTGLRSVGFELEKFGAERDDLEAVHVLFRPPLMVRALCARFRGLGPLNYSTLRTMHVFRHFLASWFRGPLDLRRFDGVIGINQNVAYGAAWAKHRSRGAIRTIVSGYLDSTLWNNIRDYGLAGRENRAAARHEERIFALTDLAACSSGWARTSLIEDCHMPPERTIVVPPTATIGPARDYGASQGRLPRMIYIGNDWERKGGDLLLRWHQQRWSERAELHIASANAPRLDSARNVVFHGAVPRQKLLDELVPQMDVFVMPTRLDQSCWPGVECQASGIPAISSRTGGVPDVIEDGVTGFLCPAPVRRTDGGQIVKTTDEGAWFQAIETLLFNPELRARMGRAAQERARRLFAREVAFGRWIERMKEMHAHRAMPARAEDRGFGEPAPRA